LNNSFFTDELVSELEKSAEAKRLLVEELQKAQRNQYKRYYLIQALKLTSSKRTKADLATIH